MWIFTEKKEAAEQNRWEEGVINCQAGWPGSIMDESRGRSPVQCKRLVLSAALNHTGTPQQQNIQHYCAISSTITSKYTLGSACI